MSSLSKHYVAPIELFIHDRTGERFASISGTSNMLGVTRSKVCTLLREHKIVPRMSKVKRESEGEEELPLLDENAILEISKKYQPKWPGK